MKKFIALLLTVCSFCAITACGDNGNETSESSSPTQSQSGTNSPTPDNGGDNTDPESGDSGNNGGDIELPPDEF